MSTMSEQEKAGAAGAGAGAGAKPVLGAFEEQVKGMFAGILKAQSDVLDARESALKAREATVAKALLSKEKADSTRVRITLANATFDLTTRCIMEHGEESLLSVKLAELSNTRKNGGAEAVAPAADSSSPASAPPVTATAGGPVVELFFPRDGRVFELVLEFLLYGEVVTQVEDAALLTKLAADADYFVLPKLKEQAEARRLSLTEGVNKEKEELKAELLREVRAAQQQVDAAVLQAAKVVQDAKVAKYIKLTNGTCTSSGAFWTWAAVTGFDAQVFAFTKGTDIISVVKAGTYLVSVRTATSTGTTIQLSLHINGSEIARCNTVPHTSYYATSLICEPFALNKGDMLKVQQSASGALNGDPNSQFSLLYMGE